MTSTQPSTPSAASRPASIDELIATLQREFPAAHLRITGRSRTVRRQAELMAQRVRANRAEFVATYRPSRHISDMLAWVDSHPRASAEETTQAFEDIIRAALARGARVSNHLSDSARDISWPIGSPATLQSIEDRIRSFGGSVLREPDAAGGRHWHVDW